MRKAIAKCRATTGALSETRERRSQSKLIHSLVIWGCVAFSGGIGYTLGAFSRGPGSILQVRQVPPWDCYLAERSFSEVESTKAALQALAIDSLTQIRVRHDVSARSAEKMGPGNRLYATEPARAIQALERAVKEFAGTEQEAIFVHELLWLLKKENERDRWLDLYLNAFYRHPTHPLVDQLDRDARWISDAVGRRDELTHAIYLRAQIPPAFIDHAQSLGTRHAQHARVQLSHSPDLRPSSAP